MNWRITSMSKYILGNVVWCYQNRTPLQTFCGDNLIFKNFNKLSLVKTLFNQNTVPNVLEHYQTFHEGALKYLKETNFRGYKFSQNKFSRNLFSRFLALSAKLSSAEYTKYGLTAKISSAKFKFFKPWNNDFCFDF